MRCHGLVTSIAWFALTVVPLLVVAQSEPSPRSAAQDGVESSNGDPLPQLFDTQFDASIRLESPQETLSTEETISDSDIAELSPSLDTSVTLDRIESLLETGTPDLAEALLVRHMPPRSQGDAWLAWKNRLWDIYAEQDRWELLAFSLEEEAEGLEPGARTAVLTRAAEAQLRIGEPALARETLRTLFRTENKDARQLAQWRRLVIETYVHEDDLDNANAAIVRYQYEFFPDDAAWLLMRARLLIRGDQPTLATNQLSALQSEEARMLRALSRLRDGSLAPEAVVEIAEEIRGGVSASERLYPELLRLVVEASQLSGDLRARTNALEQLSSVGWGQDLDPIWPSIGSDELLQSYRALAREVGNTGHLLIGDHSAWIIRARELLEEDPMAARAILAMILSENPEPEVARASATELVDVLLEGSLYLLSVKLFGPEGVFEPYTDLLEASTGLRLSTFAVQAGDFPLASRLSDGISVPPEGVGEREWNLRRARLAVFAGEYQRGTDLLIAWVNRQAQFEPNEIDQILQVAFDLQSLKQHAEAMRILEATARYVSTRKQQREMLFWMAESKAGQDQHDQSADLFLRSAFLGDHRDLWGQSARYRAAEALTAGGLINDAQRIYQALLRETQDPKRRLRLQQRIQEIKLLESADVPT